MHWLSQDGNACLKKKTSCGALDHDGDGSNQAHEEEGQQPEALVSNLAIKEDEEGEGEAHCPPQTSPHHDQGLTPGNAVTSVLEQGKADCKDDPPDCLEEECKSQQCL